MKLKTLGELLAIATETEAALKDHEKEKGGRRSEEASLLKQKIKNQWRYKSLDRKKPNAPAQKNENGDEKKQAKKISLKERLSKVGDFDESKVYAIFGMLIANGQLTLLYLRVSDPPRSIKLMIPTTAGSTGCGTYTKTVFCL